jgi:iron complex outermembrane recepter protein
LVFDEIKISDIFAAMRHLVFLLFIIPVTALAQAQDTAIVLKYITITQSSVETTQLHTPLSYSSINSRQIRRGQPQLTLAESLPLVPGVVITNADNFTQDVRIAIRGFGARSAFGIRGVRILVDDLPESTPDGQGQVDNLDMGAISHMEVLRGATAGLYGNAAGGVIRMQTDSVATLPTLSLQSTAGSWGYQQYRVAASRRWGQVGARVSVAHQRLDGYREHSAMQSTILNSKITWHNRISLIINYSDSPQADDAGAVNEADATNNPRAARPQNVTFMAGETVRQGKVGLTGKHKWKRRQQLDWQVFGVSRQFANRLPVANSGVVTFERRWVGAHVQYTVLPRFRSVALGSLTLHTGYENQRDDRQRYDNNTDGSNGTLRLDQIETFDNQYFGLLWSHFNNRWGIVAATRYDQIRLLADDRLRTDGTDDSGKRTFQNLNPMAGINYGWFPRLHLYANYATAFETPTLTELANPTLTGGFNRALNPQRTQSVEAGAKGEVIKRRLHYDVAAYRMESNNELVAYEEAAVPGVTFYRNGGATHRMGVEMALDLRFARQWHATGNWSFAQFEYQTGTNEGNRLPGLPGGFGLFALQYLPATGFYCAIEAQHTGQLWADDANTVRIAPVTRWSARCGYRHVLRTRHVLECFAGGRNLTNERFYGNIRINAAGGRYFEPGAGRGWHVGVRWEFTKVPRS